VTQLLLQAQLQKRAGTRSQPRPHAAEKVGLASAWESGLAWAWSFLWTDESALGRGEM